MLQHPTPDQLHGTHIKQALDAGKHVIVTKPMLTSLDGVHELLKASELSGKLLFVGQSSRFFEPMIHQRNDYLAGRTFVPGKASVLFPF